MRTKALIVICAILVFSSSMLYAACTGSSPMWTSTPDYASLSSCVTSASSGDTINVLAGDGGTWTSTLDLGSKKLSIIGAGIDSTIITSNLSAPNAVIKLGSGGSRLSNMTITGATTVFVDGQGFIIDRMKFNRSSLGDSVFVTGTASNIHPTGVIHSCQFLNGRIVVDGAYGTLDQMSVLWAQVPDIGGGENIVYIEDNKFTKTIEGTLNAIDGCMSARVVVRHNILTASCTTTNSALYFEAHSVQGANRGFQYWEFYNNTIENQGALHYFPFRIRAGSGVVFNNRILGNWGNYGVGLDNRRDSETFITSGKCDGTSYWDGNEYGEAGYPCRDQIGRMYDTVLWENSTASPYTQPLMPAYAWNNKKADNTTEVPFMVINGSTQHIKANRDFYNYTVSFNGTSGVGSGLLAARPSTCTVNTAYFATDVGAQGTLYKCMATNTWTKYYEPYTYPHPLRVQKFTGNLCIGCGGLFN